MVSLSQTKRTELNFDFDLKSQGLKESESRDNFNSASGFFAAIQQSIASWNPPSKPEDQPVKTEEFVASKTGDEKKQIPETVKGSDSKDSDFQKISHADKKTTANENFKVADALKTIQTAKKGHTELPDKNGNQIHKEIKPEAPKQKIEQDFTSALSVLSTARKDTSKDARIISPAAISSLRNQQGIESLPTFNPESFNTFSSLQKSTISELSRLPKGNSHQAKAMKPETENTRTDAENGKIIRKAISHNQPQAEKPRISTEHIPEHVVSRETLPVPKESLKSTDNHNFLRTTADFHESSAITGKMKSELGSDLPSGNNQQGFSMNQAERAASVFKNDDNPVFRHNLQQQIDQMFQKARMIVRDNGNAQLTTRLNPEELGEIGIKLILKDGKLKGRFTVENDTVQKELQDKLGKLLIDLKNDGFEIDGFQVDVKSEQGSQNFRERIFESGAGDFHHNFRESSEYSTTMELTSNEISSGEIYA